MIENKFEVTDTALIRTAPVEERNFIRNDLVITKEEFVACYNKWIKESE